MSEHAAEQDHLLANHVYDGLKHTAQIGLPALGTLYFTLAQIWPQVPAGEQVVGTIMAVDAFLGILLGYSTKTYNESEAKYGGEIVLSPGETTDTTRMATSFKTAALADKDEIVLKVNRTLDPPA